MSDKENECILCTNPKLTNSEYCEWCQSKIDSYEPDDKESDDETFKKDE